MEDKKIWKWGKWIMRLEEDKEFLVPNLATIVSVTMA